MREPMADPRVDQPFGLLTDYDIDQCIERGLRLVHPYDPSRLADTGYYLKFSDELSVFYQNEKYDIRFSDNDDRITLKPKMVTLLHCVEEINLPDSIFVRLRPNDRCRLGFRSMADVKMQSGFFGNADVKLHNEGNGSVDIRVDDQLAELEFYYKRPSPLVRPKTDRKIVLLLYYMASEHDLNNLVEQKGSLVVRVFNWIGKALRGLTKGLSH